MTISVFNMGKRYLNEWIFKQVNYTFEQGKSYALIGANGSGKSTLLQCIAGAIHPTKGSITYTTNYNTIPTDAAYNYISMAAPYLELVEELTLWEMFQFHLKFKPLYSSLTITQIIELVQLTNSTHKQIGNFSSGMKQRAKLALAFFSNTTTLLLDEPTANLDEQGITLYHTLLQHYHYNRTIIISSNTLQEYRSCQHILNVNDYK